MKRDKQILVIGDVMLDVSVKGDAKRLSPEAPCPVLDNCALPIKSLGGAANVARQLSASFFEVALCGCIGDDLEGTEIKNLIDKDGIMPYLIEREEASTTLKTRYLTNNNRQLLRVDKDNTYVPTLEDYKNILEEIDKNKYSAIVISDYNKGFLSHELCNLVIAKSRQHEIPVIVDIKQDVSKYIGATVIKGNRVEIERLINDLEIPPACLSSQLQSICNLLKCDYVIMTDGGNGIHGFSVNDGFVSLPASNVPIFDVTGAGDVVTAFIVMLLLDGKMSFRSILDHANKAAEKKVSRSGNSPISIDEINHDCKLVDFSYLKKCRKNRKLVFTNGCFDIIHAGHVSLLKRAKTYGDILVVAVNSDSSIKRLKGERRPINNLKDRISVLSAISCIDYILVFDEDTPESLIEEIIPDVLIKGGDYDIPEIVGSEFVKAMGGEVYSLPLYETLSSTNILNQMSNE